MREEELASGDAPARDDSAWMAASRACRYIHISYDRLLGLIGDGEIPAVERPTRGPKLRTRVYVRIEDLDSWRRDHEGRRQRPAWDDSVWMSASRASRYIHMPYDKFLGLIGDGEIPAVESPTRGSKRRAHVHVRIEDLDQWRRAYERRRERPAVAAALARSRGAAGLTQSEAGLRLGVSQSEVANWEVRGIDSLRLLERIADVYGCSLDELVGRAAPAEGGGDR